MILTEELLSLGHVLKTHGIKGELSVSINLEMIDEVPPFFIFEMEGIMVPFTVVGFRERGSKGALVSLARVDDELQAKSFVGKEVFIEDSYVSDDYIEPLSWGQFLDYEVYDEHLTHIGTLDDYDDSTMNIILHLSAADGSEYMIPAADELIVSMDEVRKKLIMHVPFGLLDINSSTSDLDENE